MTPTDVTGPGRHTSAAGEWDRLGSREQPSWYLDPEVAQQKRDAHLELIRRWTAGLPIRSVLKTDVFEEAAGPDAILSDLFPETGLTVIGSDVAFSTVARARERSRRGIHFCVSDVRHNPFASEKVDLIVSTSTLDHFDTRAELDGSLAELVRSLRRGGMLIVTVDNPDNPLYPLLARYSRSSHAPFRLGHTYSAASLRRALESLGCTVVAEDCLIHNPRMISTALFLGVRRVFGNRGAGLIRLLLALFAAAGRLPTRRFTACFIAACAVKR